MRWCVYCPTELRGSNKFGGVCSYCKNDKSRRLRFAIARQRIAQQKVIQPTSNNAQLSSTHKTSCTRCSKQTFTSLLKNGECFSCQSRQVNCKTCGKSISALILNNGQCIACEVLSRRCSKCFKEGHLLNGVCIKCSLTS